MSRVSIFLPILLLISAEAFAEPCQDLANNLLNYINPGGRRLHAQVSVSKVRTSGAQHSSFGENNRSFRADRNRQKIQFPMYVSFSDRSYYRGRRDIQNIVIHKGGKVQVILASWGNASYWLDDLSCEGTSYISGVYREPNGTSAVALTIKKL